MTLSLSKFDGKKERWRPVVLGLATDGIAPVLQRRSKEIAEALNVGCVIALADVRGTGASSSGSDRGHQSAATSYSATHLMLGQPLLGGQLRDLRAVWQHLQRREDILLKEAIVAGGCGVAPLASDAPFAYPRRIDGRPAECQPSGALVALLLGLFEDDVKVAIGRHGLVSYHSVLQSPFVQLPHESIMPGMLRDADLPDLVALLAPREVTLEGLVDGRGRLVPALSARAAYESAFGAYTDASAASRLQIVEPQPK
jgi:hypothetical protein